MLPWVVRDAASGAIIGSTRYHDIVPAIDRVEIGYTLVRAQLAAHARQHRVQAAAARARVRHARLPGRRACAPTTSTSARSAPSRRSARKKDGVIRHHAARRDGTARDTVMYSILAANGPTSDATCSCGWPDTEGRAFNPRRTRRARRLQRIARPISFVNFVCFVVESFTAAPAGARIQCAHA